LSPNRWYYITHYEQGIIHEYNPEEISSDEDLLAAFYKTEEEQGSFALLVEKLIDSGRLAEYVDSRT